MIKRKIKKEIIEHLDKDEMTIIIGARQVGKTTLLKEILDELKNEKHKVLFLNLDVDSDARYFETQEMLLKKISLEIGDRGYVFIDEIQRLTNAGLFLKGLYDRDLNYKFVITGSGSIELKEKIHESLAGRKRMIEMQPVSFMEFVNYKTEYKYEDRIDTFFEVEREKTNGFLNEYLNFGGYPRIITEPVVKEKQFLMEDIFKSYIEKDLVYLMGIERPDIFRLLIQILAAQTGTLLNFSELAKHAGLSVPTLKKYLWYAEKTFCIQYVSPFYTNSLKEITKSPIYYFTDIGLRNFALGQMGNLIIPNQFGFVFQNFIFNSLKFKALKENLNVHFWRTKDKAEVDFVLSNHQTRIPVEVKYGNIKRTTVSRSFRSFIEKYQPAEAWFISRNFEAREKINNTIVKFIPFYKI